jgi:hypothetical protein
VNVTTSRDRNYPETNDIYSNRVELGQAVVYVERLPDSVQREHVDWGFHLTGFFGTDYRSTTNKGYFSRQLLDHDRQYGFDPVLEYADVYFPNVAKGMNVRMGRFISIQLHLQPLATVCRGSVYRHGRAGDDPGE